MAKFDESKVINALHTDKAEIGKKYWFSDNLKNLKQYVEQNITGRYCNELISIEESNMDCVFRCGPRSFSSPWSLLYPYEEPPKKLMTNRQLAEWLAKGNGELTQNVFLSTSTYHEYLKGYEDKEVEDYLIRPFGTDEWIEPTYERYLVDCKHISQDEIDINGNGEPIE